ncbi:MAG: hypothetical protein P8009_09245 [Gammaproteobacteria bacterium]|nr:hypothetical protein [Gammaproteobacteria bacterium]
MNRRLFFLFPTAIQVRSVVSELREAGVGVEHIHAVARKGATVGGLPVATPQQRRDTARRVERWLWRANLGVFALALLLLLGFVVDGHPQWAWVPLLLMLATFVAGERFSTQVPNTHLDEFADALDHGEILVMVDVPKRRVGEIESLIHRRHPEATVGGVGWAVGALGI